MLTSIQYYVISLFFLICIVLSIVLMWLAYCFAPKEFTAEKVQIYECGFDPFSSKRIFFDIHFYIIAILFIIFDLEVAYLIPWAVNPDCILGYSTTFSTTSKVYYSQFTGVSSPDVSPSLSFILFFIIIILGFVYEFLKGSLDWTKNIVKK